MSAVVTIEGAIWGGVRRREAQSRRRAGGLWWEQRNQHAAGFVPVSDRKNLIVSSDPAAAFFKFAGMDATAGCIASAGFPIPWSPHGALRHALPILRS